MQQWIRRGVLSIALFSLSLAHAQSFVSLSLVNMPAISYVGDTYTGVQVKVTNATSSSLPLQRLYDITLPAGFTQTANACSNVTLGANGASDDSCLLTGNFTPTTAGTNTWSTKITAYNRDLGDTYSVSTTVTNPTPILTASWTHPLPDTSIVGAPKQIVEMRIDNIGDSTATFASTPVVWSRTEEADFTNEVDTCGTTLAAGASCYYSFAYSPTTAGSKSINAVVTYNDSTSVSPGATTSTASATSVTAAWTTDLPSTSTIGTTSQTATVTYTNGSSRPAYNFVPTVSETSPADFHSETTTCTSTLTASATCTLSVTFAPVTTGSKSISASGTYDGGTVTSVASATSTASGTPSVNAAWTTNLPFTSTVGSTSQQVVLTYTNNGTSAQTDFEPNVSESDDADFSSWTNVTGGACPDIGSTGTIAANGGVCAYTSVFAPTTTGNKSATATDTGTPTLSVKSVTSVASNPPNPLVLIGGPVAPDSDTGWYTHISSNITPTASAPVTLRYLLFNPSSSTQTYTLTIPSGITHLQSLGNNDCVTGGATLASGGICVIRLQYKGSSAGEQTLDPLTIAITDKQTLSETLKFTTVANNFIDNTYNGSSTYPLFSGNAATVTSVVRNGDYLYAGTETQGLGVTDVVTATGAVSSNWSQYTSSSSTYPLTNASVGVVKIKNSKLYVGELGGGVDVTSLTSGLPAAAWTHSGTGIVDTIAFDTASTPAYIVLGTLDSANNLQVASLDSSGNISGSFTPYTPTSSSIADVYINNSKIYVATQGDGLLVNSISSTGVINPQNWVQYKSGASIATGWPSTTDSNSVNSIIKVGNYLYIGTNGGMGFVHLSSAGVPNSSWNFYTTTATIAAPFALSGNLVGTVTTDTGENQIYIGTNAGVDICTVDSLGQINSMIAYDETTSNATGAFVLDVYGSGTSDSSFYASGYGGTLFPVPGLGQGGLP